MLLGFISDIHANLPALEAVLADVAARDLDALICLGDFVGYGAQPNEAVEIAAEKSDVSIVGNHDLAAIGSLSTSKFNPHARTSAEWTSGQLTDSAIDALKALEPARTAFGLALAHGSPRNPISEYVTDAQVAAENFAAASFDIAVVGHTHVPAVFELHGQFVSWGAAPEAVHVAGGRAILNPGSVGQPRDGDPRASWAVFDSATSIFEVRRVKYDVARAQLAIRQAGLPEIHASRLQEGR